MKKLMIALAVVACATMVQASSITWGLSTGRLYNGTGSTGSANYIAAETPVYLLVATAGFGQTDLVAAYAAAKGDSAKTLAAATTAGVLTTTAGEVASGRIGSVESTYSAGGATAENVYFVIFGDKQMYLSSVETVEVNPLATSEHEIAFSSQTDYSKALPGQASSYTGGAGWVAVPEPTSGLLMLLGMAGLALKRKRA